MYRALYRKYRPKTFSDVVGQTAITTTLSHQVDSGKVSHAYLFTGSRGTGKTTCAKIMAKAVNCLHPVNGNPCGHCEACKSIEAGMTTDIQEIDAASNTGVDNIRDIRDEAIYPPAELKKRIYIIDEVHMLSTSAFNALLKLIEEPPEYLLFIFATTEIQKVPATIISRCQRFSFRRISAGDISERICYVASCESIDISKEGADALARLADGALRDGLSLLDQCASATDDPLTESNVYQILGLAGQQRTTELMETIISGDTVNALKIFSDLYTAGKAPASVLGELSSLARDLLIAKVAGESGLDLFSSGTSQSDIKRLSSLVSTQELMRIITLIQETTGRLAGSSDQQIDVELTVIQLCSPTFSLDVNSLSAMIGHTEAFLSGRISKLERALQTGKLVVDSIGASEENTVVNTEGQKSNNILLEEPSLSSQVRNDNIDPENTMMKAQNEDKTTEEELEGADIWRDILNIAMPDIHGPASGLPSHVLGSVRGATVNLISLTPVGWKWIQDSSVQEVIILAARQVLKTDDIHLTISNGLSSSPQAADPLENIARVGKDLEYIKIKT